MQFLCEWKWIAIERNLSALCWWWGRKHDEWLLSILHQQRFIVPNMSFLGYGKSKHGNLRCVCRWCLFLQWNWKPMLKLLLNRPELSNLPLQWHHLSRIVWPMWVRARCWCWRSMHKLYYRSQLPSMQLWWKFWRTMWPMCLRNWILC